MSRFCMDLPPFAPDYSGAASALFDLGGIVVMHDASGCTGNYTGFDEPRWPGSRSAVFCSGLRRFDAIMGNDRKFIDRTLEAAKSLHPTLIAYLGSPVPMVIGTDLEGMAAETEAESRIPSFGFHTTGQSYYDKGASEVFVSLIKRFAKPPVKNSGGEKSVNIFGMLPLDFGNRGNCERILAYVKSCGYEICSCFAMGLDIAQIERCASADRSIVVSHSGLKAAEYLERHFGIPYLCGVPLGNGEVFEKKLKGGFPLPLEGKEDSKILIIHEQIFANSLREEILYRWGIGSEVGNMFGLNHKLALPNDIDLPDEKSVRNIVNSGKYRVIIGDPEIKKLLKRDDTIFVPLPHAAVSSKLHWDEYPDYLGEEMATLMETAVSVVRK